MALINQTTTRTTDRRSGTPSAASLRWGLGWTIVVAGLGISAGIASAAPRDDDFRSQSHVYVESPAEADEGGYSACVYALGQMPDAIAHHVDACKAVAFANIHRVVSRAPASGVQAWYVDCLRDIPGSADTVEQWVKWCADDAAAHIGFPRNRTVVTGTADTLERRQGSRY